MWWLLVCAFIWSSVFSKLSHNSATWLSFSYVSLFILSIFDGIVVTCTNENKSVRSIESLKKVISDEAFSIVVGVEPELSPWFSLILIDFDLLIINKGYMWPSKTQLQETLILQASSWWVPLTQSKYICYLLNKTNLVESKPISSPMVSGCKLCKTGFEDFLDPNLYRSVVGSFQYATITRPEISFYVNKVCQFMAKPIEEHWTALRRTLGYLKGTTYWCLHLQPAPLNVPFHLIAYYDTDWASDPDDRRSTSSATVFPRPNLISWWSKKQTTIARSSTEAEYRSSAHATTKVPQIQTLSELHIPHSTPVIFYDNLSTVALATIPSYMPKPSKWSLISFMWQRKLSIDNFMWNIFLDLINVLMSSQRLCLQLVLLLFGPNSRCCLLLEHNQLELAGGVRSTFYSMYIFD